MITLFEFMSLVGLVVGGYFISNFFEMMIIRIDIRFNPDSMFKETIE
jgi:hypothetical protein